MTHLTFVHGSAGHGGQWRHVVSQLPASWRAATPTLPGYDGRAPGPGYSLDSEVEVVLKAMPAEPTILVGHSFGGVVALAALMARPERVRALVLIEPVLFSLLDGAPYAATGRRVRSFFHDFVQAVRRGEATQAARDFMRFWRMEEAWERMDDERRSLLARAMPKVALECTALAPGSLPASAIAAAPRVPALVVGGTHSAAHMPPVLDRLGQLWPHAGSALVPGAGHMAPVTHPAETARVLHDFVEALLPAAH